MPGPRLAPNAPLNIPALEALESMTGFVPEDMRQQILTAPLTDDLSGLREIGLRMVDADNWEGIKQPKQEIGDYVEACGFKVPRRYGSFDGAMQAVNGGATVLMRSEHPQEYAGFSGLLRTYRLNTEEIEQQKIAKYYLQPGDRSMAARYIASGLPLEDVEFKVQEDSFESLPLTRYLSLSGQSENDFVRDLSYSFWEYIPGKNVAVVADDAIPDRYHITTMGKKEFGGGIYLPDGIEEAEYPKEYPAQKDPLDAATRAALIETYEAIRQLPRFAARNCPIMEMQLGEDGTIWFLQYHKARPFRPTSERLDPSDYPAKDGWFKAEAVRGALGSFVTLQTALWYTVHPRRASMPGYVPGPSEEASFDLHYDTGLTEYISPRRIAYLSNKSYQRTYLDMSDGCHEVRSRWFKPHAALSIGKAAYEAMLPKDGRDKLSEGVHNQYKMGGFVLDYASDGLRGYVRSNPDAKQPKMHYVSSDELVGY